MSKCARPYCNGTVIAGSCLLCCRAPEGTTPEPLDMPLPMRGRPEVGAEITVSPRLIAQREKLVAYVASHPGLTARELARAWELETKTMAGRLNTALNRGLVSYEGSGTSREPYTWWAVEDEEEASA